MSIEKDAGPNYFELSSPGVTLKGVLEELPAFGLSTKWEATPMAALGDELKDFFMSDVFQGVAEIFNGNNTNQVSVDEWSGRMYNGNEYPAINLKFKIFTENSLGQTPAKIWIANLAKYATINSGNKISIGTMLQNVKDGLAAAEEHGGDALFRLLYGGTKEDDELLAATKMAIVSDILSNELPRIVDEVKEQWKNLYVNSKNSNETNEHWKTFLNEIDLIYDGINTGTARNGGVVKRGDYSNYNVKDRTSWFSKSAEDYLDSSEYKFKACWATREPKAKKPNGGHSSETIGDFMDTKLRIIKADDVIDKIKDEDSDWKDQKVFYADQVERFYREVIHKANEVIAKYTKDDATEAFDEAKEKDAFTQVQNMMEQKYGPGRVESMPSIGARLWHLKIYSFIFKHPITVCITNWSVTPSKEMYGLKHVYYEFNIECKMDQIPDSGTWSKIFN